ncbi:MAG: reverse transcriptase domain-containing protein [Cyanobacteria bacterium J06600_6]
MDTGSDVSILPANTFNKFFQNALAPFNDAKLTYFNDSEITVQGILPNTPCQFENKEANIDFLVCNKPGVLGVDAIAKFKMSIQGEETALTTYSIQRTQGDTVPDFDNLNSTTDVESGSLPKIKGFQFFIQLKENAPTSIIQKPRRVPFALESAIEKEISKLLQNDIIEEVDSSPYLSPIVVVPKGNDEIRLCVDYKKINQYIVVDQHPLPTADEIFAKLSGARIFSKLDLRAAYHQLEIREDSRNLTAFTSHVGQFRYKRLPFGLANAPSAYMKVIFNILRNCPNAVSYLDDILIFGKDIAEHDRCLKLTLEKLREYGLTLNEGKCQYRQTSVQFLGRVLDREGVSPLSKTLDAIQKAEQPHDKHSLRAFMGLVNFYRNFIPNASLISTNLYDLLKDNVTFKWTETHTKEFNALKDSLSNCTPLAFFDTDLNTATYITTDASGYGIGAVLSQVDRNGCERPVYFLSRKLSEIERTWAIPCVMYVTKANFKTCHF